MQDILPRRPSVRMSKRIFITFAVFIVCATLAHGTDDLSKIQGAYKECKEQLGITVPTPPEVICLHNCLNKKIGIVNENNELDVEEAERVSKQVFADNEEVRNIAMSIIQACATVKHTENDTCGQSADVGRCLKLHTIELLKNTISNIIDNLT